MAFDVNERLVQIAAGVYVTQDVLNIVEKIMEYDPNLRIKYLDPDRGGDLSDPPYKIVELCPDGMERVVMGVWSLDERVLERLWAADTQKKDILAHLDRTNDQARKNIRRYRENLFEEAKEITQAIVKSPKDTYTMPHPADKSVTQVFSSVHAVKRVTKQGTEVKATELME